MLSYRWAHSLAVICSFFPPLLLLTSVSPPSPLRLALLSISMYFSQRLMKTLQTSGAANERVGQCINTALKEESDGERKPEEMGGKQAAGVEDKGGGGGGGAQIWKFNYNCALAVIPLV